MRSGIKNTLLTFILAAGLIGCTAQPEPKQYADYSSSSGFRLTNADSVSVENLEVLAKVWGFAKYHHPVFAGDRFNADYELFELLPKVAYAEEDERNAVLLDWVKGLGEFRSAEKRLRKEIADKGYTSPTDWEWLGDEEMLGAELSGLLQELRWAKRAKPSRYADITKYGHVTFDAESGAGPYFSDTGYDLLTLFRLWNMAEYYFPSVNITDKKWSEVLPEYIPKFLSTETVKWTTAELIVELSDSHSAMSNNPVYSGNKLPVELGFLEGKLIVTDNRKYLAADEEPIFEPGDEIVSIGGHTPEYFVERARKYIAASNENVLLRDAARLACFVNGTVPIVVRRYGKQMEYNIDTITRQEYNNKYSEWQEGKTYYEVLNDSVGYLYPGKFKNTDAATIMEAFANTKGIIVDMRCYPDSGIFDFIFKYFVQKKHTTSHGRCPSPHYPGTIRILLCLGLRGGYS